MSRDNTPQILLQDGASQSGGTARSASLGGRMAGITPDERRILANVATLMMLSPAHRFFFFGDLEWLVLPAIRTKQYRLILQEGEAVAFASWACISPEVEEQFISARRLSPMDWQSGPITWLVDLVAPYGGKDRLFSELRAKIFANRGFKYWRQTAQGLIVDTVEGTENGRT